MYKDALSRGLVLCSAFAMLASTGDTQEIGLPDQFFLSSQMYNAPGVDYTSEVSQALGLDYQAPVPEEVAALGLTAGEQTTRWGIIWPWIVFENGRPIALSVKRTHPAGARFPDQQTISPVEDTREFHSPHVQDVKELFYERISETIHFRARYSDGRKYSNKVQYGGSGSGPVFLDYISEGVVAPTDNTGCFRIENKWSAESFDLATATLVRRQIEQMPFSKATYCLRVVETADVPGGTQAYRMEVRIKGVSGRNGETPDKVDDTRYMIAVSAPKDVMAGVFIVASGALDFKAKELVDNINRFSADLERTLKEKTHKDGTLVRRDFDLAAQQIESLNVYLADLESKGFDWHWVKRPTAAGVLRYDELIEATEVYKLTHIDTQARLNDVRQQLEFLRTNFSANVVKSMLKSTINWLNVVPTDPISGFAGYSDIAGALLLPLSLQDWKETAASDTSILASQALAIRQFEALEIALEQRLDDIVAARRALFERIQEHDEARILELDAALR